jgi:hypothetical protein
MKIIVFSEVGYENYFRRCLFEEAINEGAEVLYIAFRRSERKIDLVRNGRFERSIPLFSTPWKIDEFVRSGNESDETVIFNSARYSWFWNILYFRLIIPRSVLVFDVYDWLYYDAKGLKLFTMKCIDMICRKSSDGIIVVTPELMSHYPGAFLLDNASHVRRSTVTKSSKNEVAIVASFDSRFDFDFAECVIDQLAEVDFHVHGWISDDNPEIAARFAKFAERQNVYYHGPYKNTDLENLLEPYSIGLLPYSTSNWISQFVNPEKIYHYLQAGMEVVSTPIPQAKRMQAYVHIAATPREFASCICSLLRGENHKNEVVSERNFHWSVRWRQLRPYLASLTEQQLR